MGEAIERGLIFLLGAVLVVLVGFILVKKFSGPDDIALFGQNTFDLCNQPSEKPETAKLEANKRVLPIDVINHSRYSELLDRIPVNRRATSKADLDAVICVTGRMQNVQSETYYKVKSGEAVAGCVREQHVTDLFLVDVKTGKTLAHQRMLGDIPGTCPDRIKETMYQRGAPVGIDKIMEWINIQLS